MLCQLPDLYSVKWDTVQLSVHIIHTLYLCLSNMLFHLRTTGLYSLVHGNAQFNFNPRLTNGH